MERANDEQNLGIWEKSPLLLHTGKVSFSVLLNCCVRKSETEGGDRERECGHVCICVSEHE